MPVRTLNVTADIAKVAIVETPLVTQNDTVEMYVKLFEKGKSFELKDFHVVSISILSPEDGTLIFAEEKEKRTDHTVFFQFDNRVNATVGQVLFSLQIYGENSNRVSTLKGQFEVTSDLSITNFTPLPVEDTLIQIVLGRGPKIIEDARNATFEVQKIIEVANTLVRDTDELLVKARELERDSVSLFESTTALNAETNILKRQLESLNEETITVRRTTLEAKEQALRVIEVMETVITETNTVKENTEKLSVTLTRELENFRLKMIEMETLRAATDKVRTDTDKVRTDTLKVQTDTNAVKNATEKVRVDTLLVKENTDKVRTDTLKVKNDTETERLNTERVRIGLESEINGIKSELIDTTRHSVGIPQGVAIVPGTINALATAEAEGNTLIPLPNSNLEAGKKYVLADKKTKVVVDGVTHSGVAKFTKGTTTVTKADFGSKVPNSTVANPHEATGNNTNLGLITPTTNTGLGHFGASSFTQIGTLNGAFLPHTVTLNGVSAQHRFSFNIIEQVERTLGLIPRTTLAEKVQWVKDNVDRVETNWHGFGSSVGGNKASLKIWNAHSNTWQVWTPSHTLNYVGRITISNLSFPVDAKLVIDENGFSHFLAYAEPSDGTTPSVINTDYVDCVITLKATAQLNTRPRIIRVANFEGKLKGDSVSVPHIAKKTGGLSSNKTLLAPSDSFWFEYETANYEFLKAIDGSIYSSNSTNVNGAMSQNLFSFNLIEEVERNIGKIPRSTVADKVAWLKANADTLSFHWYGFGSSAGGSKASIRPFAFNVWQGAISHDKNIVTKLSHAKLPVNSYLQSDGMVHLLAFAEPSDGTIPSVINTDYVELEIEMRENADFTNPKVPLYEVSDSDYAKILVDWNADQVVTRYPTVEGVQHIQGLSLTAEGDNLLPPFTEWTLHSNARVVSPYELELRPTATGQTSHVFIPCLPDRDYYLQGEKGEGHSLEVNVFSGDNNVFTRYYQNSSNGGTFRTPVNATRIRIVVWNVTNVGVYNFKNVILTLGTQPKPFVPRNPSSLLMDVKLGKVGNVADMVYEQDGRWMLRKAIEKDLVLDGSLAWANSSNFADFKSVYTTSVKFNFAIATVISATGTLLKIDMNADATRMNAPDRYILSALSTVLSVSNSESGFSSTYTPSIQDWKRYFNGWKYTDGTTWTSVTGNGQTATGQQALDTKPTDYTPYKLSYVLNAPQIIDVTDKVEGALKINGQTQVNVETGLAVREKVTPYKHSNGFVYINWIDQVSSRLKNRLGTLLGVQENGKPFSKYNTDAIAPYGNKRIFIKDVDFDPTATYTVTYLTEKPKYTVNVANVKLIYAQNIRSSLNDTVRQVEDNSSLLSVHEKMFVDLYVRLKALGG